MANGNLAGRRVRINSQLLGVIVTHTHRKCKVQRDHRITPINRLERLRIITRFAIGYAIPDVAGIRTRNGEIRRNAVMNRQVQRDHRVATVNILERLRIVTRRGIGHSIPRIGITRFICEIRGTCGLDCQLQGYN